VFEVPGDPAILNPLIPPGFRLEEHDLVLFGRCSDCNNSGDVATR
jgi:Fe2+ or Zn2+ uptake regulation protein